MKASGEESTLEERGGLNGVMVERFLEFVGRDRLFSRDDRHEK